MSKIPNRWESQIEKIAVAEKITTDEAFERVIQAGVERLMVSTDPVAISNVSLFGSVNGSGAHGSKEAIDRYIAELRNEW